MSKINKKKHIAFLLASLEDGGAERVTINLAKGLLQEGYKVDFVVFEKKGEFLSQVPNEITIYDLKSSSALKSLKPIMAYLKNQKPDVFISGKHYINVISVIAKIMSRSKSNLFLLVHGMFSAKQSKSDQILPKLVKIFYPKASKVICVSEGVAKNVRKVSGLASDNVTVIHNPVITDELITKLKEEPSDERVHNEKGPIVLGVGRLSPEKDFETLLKAFAIVRESTSAKLLILGEGPERNRLEEVIENLQLQEDVALLGYVSNPYSIMKKADVFVLSSLSEGLPTVIIEAMYSGVPIVSTDCESGPNEILENGRHGKLVPVKDYKSMANAILETISDTPDRDALQNRAMDFSLEAAVSKYIKLIED